MLVDDTAPTDKSSVECFRHFKFGDFSAVKTSYTLGQQKKKKKKTWKKDLEALLDEDLSPC